MSRKFDEKCDFLKNFQKKIFGPYRIKKPQKVLGKNWPKWDFYGHGPEKEVKSENLEAFGNLW